LIIIGAVFAGLTVLFVVIVIAFFVWVFDLFDSPKVQQAIDTTTQNTVQLGNDLKLEQFIENGRLNEDQLRAKLAELPAQQIPTTLNNLRQEANALAQKSQLLQAEADKLLNLVP